MNLFKKLRLASAMMALISLSVSMIGFWQVEHLAAGARRSRFRSGTKPVRDLAY
jgi:hypothetical protein